MSKILQLRHEVIVDKFYDESLLEKHIEDVMMGQFKRAIAELKFKDIVDIENDPYRNTKVFNIRLKFQTGGKEDGE